MTRLDEAEQSYTRVLLEPPVPFDEAMESFGRGFPTNPKLSDITSTRAGFIGNWPEAILVDRYVYDNLTPNGALPLNWIFDLHSEGRIRIHTK